METLGGEFAWHTVLAGIVCVACYIPAGLGVMRVIRLRASRLRLSDFLAAPAFGLCTFGPFSLAFVWGCGYSRASLLAAWLVFVLGALTWSRWKRDTQDERLSDDVSPRGMILLIVATALIAALPAAYLLPYFKQQALVVAEPLADHFKIAMIDTMAREGVPPLNPFYAPAGKPIVLIYYYLWYFMASQLRVLLGVTGWQADVALTWFTTFAVLGVTIDQALRLTRARGAGALCLLLALCGAPSALLAWFSPRLHAALDMPLVHQLEPLLIQSMWVPQHILSAMAIVLLIFLLSRMAVEERSSMARGACLGLVAATAFGASVWVGGIALVAISPLLLLALCRIRRSPHAWFSLLRSALTASIFFALAGIPFFSVILSSPNHVSFLSTMKFEIYPASEGYDDHHLAGAVAQIVLFWLKYLPLSLGLITITGWVGLCKQRTTDAHAASFKTFTAATAIGYALVSQFLCSIIRNNDLGWRSILVPILLLTVWSAAYLAELCSAFLARPSPSPIPVGRGIALLLCAGGIAVGLAASAVQLWHLHPLSRVVSDTPIPLQPRYHRHEEKGIALSAQRALDSRLGLKELSPLAMQRRFARQPAVWSKVREFCRPDELVLSNPDGYGCVSVFPANLPHALFADRRTPYASPESASVFAHGYGFQEEQKQYETIQEVFSASPRPEAIRFVHDVLRVKVLVIDPADDLWTSPGLEESGLYRVVYQDTEVRIYQAI